MKYEGKNEYDRYEQDDIRSLETLLEAPTTISAYIAGTNHMDRVETFLGVFKSLLDAIDKVPPSVPINFYMNNNRLF